MKGGNIWPLSKWYRHHIEPLVDLLPVYHVKTDIFREWRIRRVITNVKN